MAIEDRKFSQEKQPSEEYHIGIKFGNDLASGETISSVAITAIDLADGSDAADIILDGSAQIGTLAADNKTFTEEAGAVVAQKVKAGVDDKRYKISIVGTTSASRKYEADVIMTVIEL